MEKTSGAALAFLMHVNDFGYKLQSLYFYLLTTESEKKENTQWKGKSSNCCRWGHNRSCCKFEFCLLIVVVFVFASIIVCQELRTKLHLEENGRVEAGK